MNSKQVQLKVMKPKLINGIERKSIDIIDIEDEDIFKDVYVSDCTIENEAARHVSFNGVVFKNVNFKELELSSLDLTDVRFEDCDLSNVNFSGAIIHRVEFINCKLMGINLSDAALQNIRIDKCNGRFAFMRFSQLKKVIIEESILESSDFQNSKFNKVELVNCNFRLSQMSGTSLAGIDLSSCNVEGLGIRIEDVKGAIISPLQAVDFAKLLGMEIKS
tara:strand:+ start:105 stop:761 length:657 start_codon:yes stop_codon:yes gene_type:complete